MKKIGISLVVFTFLVLGLIVLHVFNNQENLQNNTPEIQQDQLVLQANFSDEY